MLSRRHTERNIFQYWRAAIIGEGNVIKGDFSFEVCCFNGVGIILHVRLKLQNIGNPAGSYRRAADAAGKFGQIANRTVHAVHVGSKYQNIAWRHLSPESFQ